MTPFSSQLKILRQAKNLSQEALAEQLFISRQAISKWENGDATPDLENLVKLAEIFKVSLDELVLGKKIDSNQDDENLHLLTNREYVLNPETGRYEKRDGLTLLIDIISEYWWIIFFAPILIMFIKLLINLF
ncbi:helix-turn-helix domain-containing protein [Streptococcus uberis]|uniref:helix-turn-helix domain-containing protein n=1 Tax=Streptococcus uberis TaxID=1349 RepID=UPI001FF614C5|nr:helix-turn-helix domain-containing protein [Streptococcus uberis]MCK1200418.1 helix-turn-helix domain-containing protein [Streptococcus uberis]MCK1206349.1 helix-turn-helix domain-containing protein [Streptococcus uberis]MCK1215351.1 helix-turn-helix domain-containing protein [Streptococcus uberis]